MQGYFDSVFTGEKKDIDKLLAFMDKRAAEGDEWLNKMYQIIKSDMILLPDNYNELSEDSEIEVSIGMNNAGGSGNINFFDQNTYFSEMAEASPELNMDGFYRLLDVSNGTRYHSEAGSDEIEEESVYFCCACTEEVDTEEGYFGEVADECGWFCNEEEFEEYAKTVLMESLIDYYDEEEIDYDEDELEEMTLDELQELYDEVM